MIRELICDEAILSQPCEPATADDAALAQDLIDTLQTLEEASCLAANQVGEAKALAVYLDDREKPRVIYNPKLKQGLRPFKAIETCLTREETTTSTRYDWIVFTYDELVDGALVARQRKLEGWTAQAVQHMIDHCKGKLV